MQERARTTPESTPVARIGPTLCGRRARGEWLLSDVRQAEGKIQVPVPGGGIDLVHDNMPLFLEPRLTCIGHPLQMFNTAYLIIARDFLPVAMLNVPVIVQPNVALLLACIRCPSPEVLS